MTPHRYSTHGVPDGLAFDLLLKGHKRRLSQDRAHVDSAHAAGVRVDATRSDVAAVRDVATLSAFVFSTLRQERCQRMRHATELPSPSETDTFERGEPLVHFHATELSGTRLRLELHEMIARQSTRHWALEGKQMEELQAFTTRFVSRWQDVLTRWNLDDYARLVERAAKDSSLRREHDERMDSTLEDLGWTLARQRNMRNKEFSRWLDEWKAAGIVAEEEDEEEETASAPRLGAVMDCWTRKEVLAHVAEHARLEEGTETADPALGDVVLVLEQKHDMPTEEGVTAVEMNVAMTARLRRAEEPSAQREGSSSRPRDYFYDATNKLVTSGVLLPAQKLCMEVGLVASLRPGAALPVEHDVASRVDPRLSERLGESVVRLRSCDFFAKGKTGTRKIFVPNAIGVNKKAKEEAADVVHVWPRASGTGYGHGAAYCAEELTRGFAVNVSTRDLSRHFDTASVRFYCSYPENAVVPGKADAAPVVLSSRVSFVSSRTCGRSSKRDGEGDGGDAKRLKAGK